MPENDALVGIAPVSIAPESGAAADARPMLNAYPDSMGGRLADAVDLLRRPELAGVFESFYVLPSIFNTDLDRGFSVIDYGLNETYAHQEDLDAIHALGVSLKLDFVLNHLSVLSKEFQDVVRNGDRSAYRDFFVDWNRFWDGFGEMTEAGYIQPRPELIADMFFRKPGLPILMVRFPDGREVPYWNTFYQEVRYGHLDAQDLMGAMEIQYASAVELADVVNGALDAGTPPDEIPFGRLERFRRDVLQLLGSRRRYMGQMDVNIGSPLVWEYYDRTLRTLAAYGARIVRLDAFAYAPKAPGRRNFLNDPETWDLLKGIRGLADRYGVTLLPEIHASYGERTHERIAAEGYLTYDFFLPGLVLDALERRSGETLAAWAREVRDKGLRTVTMLGCHDGIPLLDLEGLVPHERIVGLIETVVARGGHVKSLHGQQTLYYQVNATYFSALGEDERSMLLARAIHLFMPGKPQVWYLDLFAGRNDHEAVRSAGPGGHKEINRTNLTVADVAARLEETVVRDQLTLLRFRNASAAFGFDATLEVADTPAGKLSLRWEKDGVVALLDADLSTRSFTVTDGTGAVVLAQ
jgi:sucrose phosphorylase